jgi:hypothetical protein
VVQLREYKGGELPTWKNRLAPQKSSPLPITIFTCPQRILNSFSIWRPIQCSVRPAGSDATSLRMCSSGMMCGLVCEMMKNCTLNNSVTTFDVFVGTHVNRRAHILIKLIRGDSYVPTNEHCHKPIKRAKGLNRDTTIDSGFGV